MIDRKKVIKGLEDAIRVIETHVPERYRGYSRLSCTDAITLLDEKAYRPIEYGVGLYKCGKCGCTSMQTDWKYCPVCGRKVMWDV